jgi:hypothetical protein
MKTTKDAKSKGTILIADYDFGDVNISGARPPPLDARRM